MRVNFLKAFDDDNDNRIDIREVSLNYCHIVTMKYIQ